MHKYWYYKSSLKKSKYSSSGGAFYTIALMFLNQFKNSKVYGAALCNNKVMHISIESASELYKLQGSKYVQSDIGNTYKSVKDDLLNKCYVLFSGTPCQVAGLKKYLGREYEELFTVEIICHGVPSPQYWDEHVIQLEKKYNGRIENIRFRNPSKYNRHGYILTFSINGRKHRRYASEDAYYSSFIKNFSLRPSCYECIFKNKNTMADISIGDSNSEKFHPCEAISFLIFNSDKFEIIYKWLEINGDLCMADYEKEASNNKQLIEAAKKPNERKNFYSNIHFVNNKVKFQEYISNRIKSIFTTKFKNTIKNIIK